MGLETESLVGQVRWLFILGLAMRRLERDSESLVQVPEQIAATSAPGVTPVRTRPWCPYPTKVHYDGGDVNTGSFSCE